MTAHLSDGELAGRLMQSARAELAGELEAIGRAQAMDALVTSDIDGQISALLGEYREAHRVWRATENTFKQRLAELHEAKARVTRH